VNVLVLGGYGLIGQAVVLRLHRDGHVVTGLGRGVAQARTRMPFVRWVSADLAELAEPRAWAPLLQGVDAVVNAAGALQDGARDDLATVHHHAIAALVAACEDAGLRRFVQISAAGVGEDVASPFFATKALGDRAVMSSSLDWTILRPGLVLAPAAYGGTALLRALASMPLAIPAVMARQPIQTVSVDDIADAVARAVGGELPHRLIADLVEERGHTLADVLVAFRGWLGLVAVPVVQVPTSLGAAASCGADLLGHLGWRSPLRSAAMSAIAAGVVGDPLPWRRATGRTCRPLTETLSAMPANVQEVWFARLWLLKPAIIAVLSLFWLVSGGVGVLRAHEAAAVLTVRGFPASVAMAAVVAGSVIDVALGALVLWRRWARLALLGMLAVTAAYLVGATQFAPDLWLDPLGVLVKTIPCAALTVVALAILGER
jgi:uncharacterized protein YbjT (DUF2867 family)